jgi:hypothetical protein
MNERYVSSLDEAVKCARVQLENAKCIFFDENFSSKLQNKAKSLGLRGRYDPPCLYHIYWMYAAQTREREGRKRSKHFPLGRMIATDESGGKVLNDEYLPKLAEMAGRYAFNSLTKYVYAKFDDERARKKAREEAKTMPPDERIKNNVCNTACLGGSYRFTE